MPGRHPVIDASEMPRSGRPPAVQQMRAGLFEHPQGRVAQSETLEPGPHDVDEREVDLPDAMRSVSDNGVDLRL